MDDEKIEITREESEFLKRVLIDFEEKTGERKTPPKGWTYADVVYSLRISAGIRSKLD